MGGPAEHGLIGWLRAQAWRRRRAAAAKALEGATTTGMIGFLTGCCHAQARRRRREAAAKALEGAWERLQLLAAGVGPAAAGNEAAEATLARHLLRGEGEEAVDALLRYQRVRVRRFGHSWTYDR